MVITVIIVITFIIIMFFIDLLFPKFCLGCGMVGGYICNRCRKKLIYIDKDRCFYCQKPSLFGLTHRRCQKKNGIDGFMTIFYYNNLLKKIIKAFKYRRAVAVWHEMSLLIEPEKLIKINFYKKLFGNEEVVFQPIPLHSKKLRERGFNQSLIIARFFQQFLDFPIVDSLKRIKETKPQAQIKKRQRRAANLKGAFGVKNRKIISDKRVILIDDLLTSGKTAAEAATTLKKAGAKAVYVLTLAKG